VPVVDEATKYLLGQGILGVVCLAEGGAIWWLVRENRRLVDRLVQKSETDRHVNQKLAKQVADAFTAAPKRRRPTRQMGEPPAR
jgi:hypothetical protein